MKNRLPKYVMKDTTAGGLRFYFRRKGKPKVRLAGLPGTDDFNKTYYAALYGKTETAKPKVDTNTLGWLCRQYFSSADFLNLDVRTQHVRRLIVQSCLDERVSQDSDRTYAAAPLTQLTAKAIIVLRDRKAKAPEAANGRIKALRQVLAYGALTGDVSSNVARDVPYLKSTGDGFHSWTRDEVLKFEEFHKEGSKARLAMGLLLYTAQRRSDIVTFGPRNVKSGKLTFTQVKNARNKAVTLTIPILPKLAAMLPHTETTWLLTEHGKPYTAAGFGNWFRRMCNDAGLPHCSAHGLRKAAATRLAESGASERQIMAITGHSTSKEVSRYTKAVNQESLADEAFTKL